MAQHRPTTFYHGTSIPSAESIQANGFDLERCGKNAGALLGKGIYCTTTLEKALHYAKQHRAGGIVLELQVDLGKCVRLQKDDPMMKSWSENGYDSAWSPSGANGAGLEENCVKDPKRIKIVRAIAGHTGQLLEMGMTIDTNTGRLVKLGDLGSTSTTCDNRCDVAGCSRMTWNGKINEQCCRTCKLSRGDRHGPDCNRKQQQQLSAVQRERELQEQEDARLAQALQQQLQREAQELEDVKLAQALQQQLNMEQTTSTQKDKKNLTLSVGCWVKVNETFTPKGNSVERKLTKDTLGTVLQIDSDGDAKIRFQGVGIHQFVLKSQFSYLSKLSAAESKRANEEKNQAKISVGDWIKVNDTFTPAANTVKKKLEKGVLGEVVEIDSDGDAKIQFQGIGFQFVSKGNGEFLKMALLENDNGTCHPGTREHKGGCVGRCCSCEKPCGGLCDSDSHCSGDCKWTCCGKEGRRASWPGCSPHPAHGPVTVGSKVKLTSNFANFSDASDGPLKPGDIGNIVEDDKGSKPFKVRAADGREWWYQKGALESAAERLRVGTKVTMVENFANYDDAKNGPLKPGRKGTLIEDDHGHMPFHVKTKKGKKWWYSERALRAASDRDDDSDESDGSNEPDGSDEDGQSSDDDFSALADIFSSSDKVKLLKNEVHKHVECDGCGESSIFGPRWKCEDCDDFDLCGKCYGKFSASGEHHTEGHTFCRCPGIYHGCHVVTKSTVASGLKVVRGPVLQCQWQMTNSWHADWSWDDQDGGMGKTGTLQASSVDTDGWIGVKWRKGGGSTNNYRVEEAADLKFDKSDCVCGGCCIVTKGNVSSGLKVVRGPGLFVCPFMSPSINLSEATTTTLVLPLSSPLSSDVAHYQMVDSRTCGTDWKWGDQDGGIGKTGVLQSSSVDSDGWIRVKWGDDSGKYRVAVAADLKFHKSGCVCGGSKALSVGDQVRVKKSVSEPRYKWGGVSHESIGILKKIEADDDVVVNFPKATGWNGILTEIERVPAGTGGDVLSSCIHTNVINRCMVCKSCLECTGYGSNCVHHKQGRTGGKECGCGSGNSGCFKCGLCQNCQKALKTAGTEKKKNSNGDIVTKGGDTGGGGGGGSRD